VHTDEGLEADDVARPKRLKRDGGQVLLVAENPDFAPIVVGGRREALTIEGIGVGLIRANVGQGRSPG
jgi:repressor LexA